MINYDEVVNSYIEIFEAEKDSLRQLQEYLRVTTDHAQRVNRKNYVGHLTASCLFIDAINRRILLGYNEKYKLPLQPGSHIKDTNESPIEVALEKLRTETQYESDMARYLPFDYSPLVPIDIDSHKVPAAHGERAHIHHDFRYVFINTAPESLGSEMVVDNPETGLKTGPVYRWYDLEELSRWVTFSRLFNKIQKFLSRDSARRRFYIGLTTQFPVTTKVNTVLVTHILPDALDFIDALNRCTNLIGIIPKPKSIHVETKNRLLSMKIPIFDIERKDIKSELPKLLNDRQGEKTVLLDIGGWFVPILNSLPETITMGVAGIVEDTRNGQDKYEKAASEDTFPFPVVSVAESELKANEDFLVGHSIIFSADAILRKHGLVMEYLECGVIGYGKIGKSIAQHLQQRGIKPNVVETNPLRRLEAYRLFCNIRHRDWISRNTDIIFCATGKRATDIIDFRTLKPGSFIFSVTSSDDEFDFALLETEYGVTEVSSNTKRFDSDYNHFYLVNEGNAVNFLHDAVLWEFIQLVKGGIFMALRNLAIGSNLKRTFPSSYNGPGFESLFELTTEDQETIARLWMETVLLGVKLDG